MQVEPITVNAANLAVGRGMMGAAGISGVSGDGNPISEQNRMGGDSFGPACKVTISEEGKALSSRRGVKQEKEGQSAADALEAKMQRRLSEAEEEGKDAYSALRGELNEIDRKIFSLNSSSTRKTKLENDPVAKEVVELQTKLQEALKRQREYQQEESQRLAREAGEAGKQSGKYQQEIDENNRELVTLLRTVEEAEKARRQRDGGDTAGTETAGGGSDGGSLDGGSMKGGGAEVSPFREDAAHFTSSSLRQELRIEEMFSGLEETANWFIDTADSVTQTVLERSAGIRTAMTEGGFSEEEIAGMVEELQSSMPDNYQMVEDYRGFGLYLLDELQTARIAHLGNNPMKGTQEASEAALQAAAAAALGEARQSALGMTSDELAEEVRKLIERRNDPEQASEEIDEYGMQLIKDQLDFYRRMGFEGDELIDKTVYFYEEHRKHSNPAGGIEFFHNEPAEEDMAAARKLINEIGEKPDFRILSPDASKIHDLFQAAGEPRN